MLIMHATVTCDACEETILLDALDVPDAERQMQKAGWELEPDLCPACVVDALGDDPV
jgi:hypothetical protein